MRLRLPIFLVAPAALLILMSCAGTPRAQDFAPPARVTTRPVEDPNAALHNPDMGWLLYENYPVAPQPGGSSNLASLPEKDFAGVDSVAVMFTWADVERRPGEFDFNDVDHAYDFWKTRGKRIQLRMSTE